jgi:hypothetical protein
MYSALRSLDCFAVTRFLGTRHISIGAIIAKIHSFFTSIGFSHNLCRLRSSFSAAVLEHLCGGCVILKTTVHANNSTKEQTSTIFSRQSSYASRLAYSSPRTARTRARGSSTQYGNSQSDSVGGGTSSTWLYWSLEAMVSWITWIAICACLMRRIKKNIVPHLGRLIL